MSVRRYVERQPVAGTANGSPGEGVTTVAATDPIAVGDLDKICVSITGITTGTVQIQRRIGGVWQDVGSALTANGVVELGVDAVAEAVRGNVTVATTVDVEITAAGHQLGAYG